VKTPCLGYKIDKATSNIYRVGDPSDRFITYQKLIEVARKQKKKKDKI